MLIRIHERYTLGSFLARFVAVLSAFCILVTAYLLFSELFTFLEHRASFLHVVLYLAFSIPQFLVLLAPPAGAIAAVLCLHSHLKRGETVALMAAGVPPLRIAWPLLFAGLILSAGLAVFNDAVACRAAWAARDILDNQIEGKASRREIRFGRWLRARTNRFFHVEWYDQENIVLHNLVMLEMNPENDSLFRLIEEADAVWDGTRWVFHDGYYRSYQNGRESEMIQFETMTLDNLEETPEDFTAVQIYPAEMTFSQLREFIRFLDSEGENGARYVPDLYAKVAFPFGCLVLLLFAVGSGLRAGSEGIGVNLGLVMFVGFAYYVVFALALAVSRGGLFPAALLPWSPWIPNLAFGLLGAVYATRAGSWVTGG